VPAFVSQEVRTKFGEVALSQNIRSQVARTCELLHVVTIAFHIPLQLGKSQIMSLKREKAKALPRAGEQGYKPFLVIFGAKNDRHGSGGSSMLGIW
jgi:hypothetical protein